MREDLREDLHDLEQHKAIAFWWRFDDEVVFLRLDEETQMSLENIELLVAYAYLHGAYEIPDGIGIKTPDDAIVNLVLDVLDAKVGIFDELDDLAETVETFYLELRPDQFTLLPSSILPQEALTEPHTDPKMVVWGPKFSKR